MKKLKIIFIVSILFYTFLSVYGSVETERISADADWMVRIDCEQFMKSSLGQILKTELAKQENEQKLNNFKIIFGFHPINDIRNIMLYGQGEAKEKAVLLLEGNFDKPKLLASVGLSPEYKKFEYKDLEIHQWLQKDKNTQKDSAGVITYGCFYRDNLVVLGSGLPTLQQALDVLKGSASNTSKNVFNNPLLQDQDAFIQAAAANIAKTVNDDAHALIFKKTENIIVAAGERNDSVFMAVNLTANSKEVAENINQMLEGIIAYLHLASEEQPVLSHLAQKIKLTSSGDTVEIRLESAPGFIQQIISENIDKK
jgi:hypothetical protein